MRPGGKWNEERVILFTEYRATQKWLFDLLAREGFVADGRLEMIYGGMPNDQREPIKAAFQTHPGDSAVRILLATDAASEGVNLQNHCSRLIHYEIPWNPNRMEQRNGRVDRHGQKAGEVHIHHFVGQGFDAVRTSGKVGDLEADLEFLMRAVLKVETIREDLGKVGPVIASQVEEAMLGRRSHLDTTRAEQEAEPVRRMLKFERKLRDQLEKLASQLHETRHELDLTPEHIENVVRVGLELAEQPALIPVEVNGIWPDPTGVVASTATIRRAANQVQKLFVRKLDVFPPQGTSIRDSFFAIQRPAGPEYPGRRYLGICAFGRRYPVAIIRSYVAHMAAAQVLYDKYDRLADPWMTLTGYFNSIRELAGTRRLVEDDIRARLRDADQRGLAKCRVRSLEELTSRKSGTDIPKILERMESTFDKSLEAQRAAERKAGQKPSSSVPYDVILATNMISVGVDIDRLGLMLVAGQPKNTSEYIQATSRVGRSADGPGLVCTVFNWARPRDLSHYERFEHYHETFYKHVEALSVTPFSARALDRGLSGVMVALMRLWDNHLNGNQKAGVVGDTDPLWAMVSELLRQRAVNAGHDSAVEARILSMIADRREEWLRRVHNQKDHVLCYKPEGGATVGLLENAGDRDWKLFTCLNSLRDVEGTVDLVLDQRVVGLHVN